jgi:hypothetical protein
VAEAAVEAPPEQPERKSLMQRLLDGIERERTSACLGRV